MISLPDGVRVGAIAACFNGPVADGERLIGPLRKLGPPVDDGIRPMRYPEVQRIFAEIPFGLHNYWKGHFIGAMPREVVDATMEAFETMTSEHSAILIEAPHGAVRQVDHEATAFGHREARFNASALAIWEPEDQADRHIAWARTYADAVAPFALGGYVNYLGNDVSADDVRAAFGAQRFQRLVDLKTRYDPSNMFRFNQNIPPAPAE
jgi:hypothetical protein